MDPLMHPAARAWITKHGTDNNVRVLDVGGRNINGTPRASFPNADPYVTVDLIEADDVTYTGDILTFDSDRLGGPFDIIIYAEVAEHTPDWPLHLAHIYQMLTKGGLLIFTAAGITRAPHSAADGGPLRPDEHYENVSQEELDAVGHDFGCPFELNFDETHPGEDIRAVFTTKGGTLR